MFQINVRVAACYRFLEFMARLEKDTPVIVMHVYIYH